MQDAVRCDDYTPPLAVVSARCTPSSLSTHQKASSNRQPDLIPRASPSLVSFCSGRGGNTERSRAGAACSLCLSPACDLILTPWSLCLGLFVQRSSDPKGLPGLTTAFLIPGRPHTPLSESLNTGDPSLGVVRPQASSKKMGGCPPPQSEPQLSQWDPETRGSALCCICTTLPPASSLPAYPPSAPHKIPCNPEL